ncbi:ribonuclease E [Rubrimonas cliftonensis]|uniref:Ribonuclease E n=2 Tax=Rubrimonas cliftonensis TaxID=89524 RepID=A0A1H4BD44_9RHOB|nr:ribonuclease E [Rubrimonas cliftonensis]
MLIDATHPEETRVVVADGSKVEEFDFESINKRQLSGNIYLAKVTRVEPSLQAAFVEYGGNRHGFLAFSEIHPDYYQIPVADREALIAAEEAEAAEEQREAESPRPRRARPARAQPEAPFEPETPARPEASAEPEASVEPEASAEDAGSAAEPMAEAPKKPAPAKRTRSRKKPAKTETVEAADAGGDAPSDAGAAAQEAPAPEAAALGDPERTPEQATEQVPEQATEQAAEQAAEQASEQGPNEAVAGADGPDDSARTPSEDVAATRSGPASIAEGAGADSAESVSEPFEPEASAETVAEDAGAAPRKRSTRGRRTRKPASRADAPAEAAREAEPAEAPDEDSGVESVGAEEPREEMRPRKPRMRNYKIQEVIKVRQIMLVQVVKEERGNKGAALTTYLSLAGRYCVLMPNTARGGGVSRKITSAEDRKKLKEIAAEFEAPKGMGLIIRTAGAKRTRLEIKRDYEFLLRQWEEIRELTLRSVAPALIYEEGSLIKRSIRDLYSKDIDEVLVEGDEAYREAKEYMRMLMPSHAKNVKPYKDDISLFSRQGVESYLAAMFNPTVQLKSGGYIVIGVTEALVAIDVNSGRSTREGSIEETALKTNLEAADEVARQLRLRDLAGLIVIDFIDMDERRNNAAVEKRMKDRLSSDRARIQIGRISPFGLMEMSRQRLRPGMIEASTAPCPHCHGTGLMRSDDSLALSILREVEEEGVKKRAAELRVKAPVSIANYIMNQKRAHLMAIEARCGMSVMVEGDPALISPEHRIERVRAAAARPEPTPAPATVRAGAGAGLAAFDDPRADAEDDVEDEVEAEAEAPVRSGEGRQAEARAASPRDNGEDGRGDGKAKRRRGKRGGRRRRREDEERGGAAAGQNSPGGMEVFGDSEDDGRDDAETAEAPATREPAVAQAAAPETAKDAAPVDAPESSAPRASAEAAAPIEATPADAVQTDAVQTDAAQTGAAQTGAVEADAAETGAAEAEEPAKPKRRRARKPSAKAQAEAAAAETAAREASETAAPEPVAARPEPASAPTPEPAAETPKVDAVEPEPGQEAAAQAGVVAADAGEAPASQPEPAASEGEPETPRPRRRGWWSIGAR